MRVLKIKLRKYSCVCTSASDYCFLGSRESSNEWRVAELLFADGCTGNIHEKPVFAGCCITCDHS